VVWLGGDEPLLYPQIGALASALVEARRHLFLHTAGSDLRKRIHEFRPDSRLFLTLEFTGREATHDQAAGRPGAFRQALEAVRAAKLSGFLVCAHVTVTGDTCAAEIGELFECLDARDVDGFVVSSGGLLYRQGESSALGETLAEVRAMIRCSRWENFSRLLEASQTAPASERVKLGKSGASAFEESA
jgi:MoaA/NifB/PqqE/SkfB family radical SAM enzyme